jgi:lipoprotein-anchoring transpeptidase ErfK/SrfK
VKRLGTEVGSKGLLVALLWSTAVSFAGAQDKNDPALSPQLRLQILLDRAHYSVGEIDGARGLNTQRALDAFRQARKIKGGGPPSAAVWSALGADPVPLVVAYTLTEADVAGPFQTIPEDMVEKAALEALGYESALEKLAEAFHSSPKLLQQLNPGKSFDTAGEALMVPNVKRSALGNAAAAVRVDQTDASLSVLDKDDRVLARYPATMGSRHDPLPIGRFKINGVSRNPPFHYNPDLFWDAEVAHEKAKLAPGPNNPVGLVWVDLSKEHYGIHGTPVPATVGKTQSHGCIRLTNWDALELADLVAPGMPAILQK